VLAAEQRIVDAAAEDLAARLPRHLADDDFAGRLQATRRIYLRDGLVTAEQIRVRDARAFEAWMADVGRFQFPGGESLPDLVARAVPAFEALVARHAGGTIAVVAHGGSNRAILCHALGLGPERLLALGQDYAALSVLEWAGGRWSLRLLNHCEPLP